MGRKGKKYLEASEKYDKSSPVSLEEAVRILKSFPVRKMDETVELNFHLGIDGRQADQALRGTVMLPRGTGKDVCIVAITQGVIIRLAKNSVLPTHCPKTGGVPTTVRSNWGLSFCRP